MPPPTTAPVEIDSAEITILVDNTVDPLMPSTKIARRIGFRANSLNRPQPVAEFGFAALIRVQNGNQKGTLLLDTGLSPNGLTHNMGVLEIPTAAIQAIVLSHGHADHTMGLASMVQRLRGRRIPMVLHPDAWRERRLVSADGTETLIPPPSLSDEDRDSLEIMEKTDPTLLLDRMVLVSGEIPRVTDFEKGLPQHQTQREGTWEADPEIKDDQCVVLNIRGKGLAVITGCCHAGLINTIRYAQELTGTASIYAVIGGFHLSGAAFESVVPKTVAALQEVKPQYIMPGHCTGLSAIQKIASAFPNGFVPTCVGTTFML
jgi:7,8-dihydropterin-6-yl-methyl-4-(beta-D-ribofuranosyl)aminobenzene 5'-phosphate synthase